MSDFLIRGMAAHGMVRFAAVQTCGMVERMRQIHHTMPLATAALGRALTVCSMMGDDLKSEKGSVTLQIRGGGPLGSITAVADSCGNTRGYLQNPALELPLRPDGKLDVGGGVGCDGVLTVIRDDGEGEPFSGKVELRSGEIAEDVAAYFAESEQIPTVCALGVLVGRDQSVCCAGGFLIQLMPGAEEQVIDLLEQRIAAFGSVTGHLQTRDIKQVMTELLQGLEPEILRCHEVAYECKCSREKVEQALLSMGRSELQRLAEEQKETRVTCQFCDTEYVFSPEQLMALLREQKDPEK